MNKKEQAQCNEYRRDLESSKVRLADLEARGVEAVSQYDIKIASSGDVDRALWMAKHLVGNHVSYFGEKVAECDKVPQQVTLFDAFSAPDSHLEAAYEDQQSGIEDL